MSRRRKDTIHVGAELDRDTDLELGRWAKAVGRSKRNLATVLLKKLTSARRAKPELLVPLFGEQGAA